MEKNMLLFIVTCNNFKSLAVFLARCRSATQMCGCTCFQPNFVSKVIFFHHETKIMLHENTGLLPVIPLEDQAAVYLHLLYLFK